MSEALENFKKEYTDNRPELSTDEIIAAENAIESAWSAALEQTSTAEIKAQGMDDLAGRLEADVDVVDVGRGHILSAIDMLRHEAKRIREEG